MKKYHTIKEVNDDLAGRWAHITAIGIDFWIAPLYDRILMSDGHKPMLLWSKTKKFTVMDEEGDHEYIDVYVFSKDVTVTFHENMEVRPVLKID
jgi:hypothetical protein